MKIPTIENITINSLSGRNVILTIRNTAQPKGVVLMNTGTCIPQRVYWNFADFLCENGYTSITYDYGDAQNFKSKVSHTDWILDIEAALQYVAAHFSGIKKYCVGHSSGGQLLGFAPSAQKMDKLFLVASANGFWRNMRFPFKYLILFLWYILVPVNIAVNGFFNNKMYGVSGGFPKNIMLELRHFCLTPQFFIPFFKSRQIPFYYDEITCPVKAYHLGDDQLATLKGCTFILKMYKNAEKSIETLNARDYNMKPFGHRGFFNAKGREKLWHKFLKEIENT
jgi:predicted alpha/beta hydrolase